MKNSFVLLVLAFAIAFVGSMSYFTVDQREQAIVLQFGDPRKTVTESGLHFKMPWQNILYFEKRVLNLDTAPEDLLLADQRRVTVDTFVRYKIIDPLQFSISLQNEQNATATLTPFVNDALRGVLGNVTLLDVLSADRDEIMDRIKVAVNRRLKKEEQQVVEGAATQQHSQGFGIQIVDFRIGRVDLPKSNNDAIYARMRSEREREAAEARAQGEEVARQIKARADREKAVLLAEAEKDAQILRGEGDGQAIKIFADAFNRDAEFYEFYRSMEAYRNSMTKQDNLMILGPEGDFFKFFNQSE